MNIEKIDPDNFSDEIIKKIHDFKIEIENELDPKASSPTVNEIKRHLADVDKYYPTQHHIARDQDGIITELDVSFFNRTPEANDDDLKKADVSIRVKKDQRRKGIASSILKYTLENLLLPRHKEIIISTTAECGYEFCKALGGKQVSKAIVSRYFFDKKDYSVIEKINNKTKESSSDIDVIITDELFDENFLSYLQLLSDLECEISQYAADYVFNEELFKSEILNWYEKEKIWGVKKLFALGYDKAGKLAGFSELYMDPEHTDYFETCMTGIRKEFRKKGLCKRLKTDLMLHIKNILPDVRYIKTDNDEENSVMRGINDKLGFIPDNPYIRYRFDVEELKKKLEE